MGGQKLAEGRKSVAADDGPNRSTRSGPEISRFEGDAESRVGTPERPWKLADGIRWRPGSERQANPAMEDMTGPQTQKLMEEVLRRENLFRALKRVRSNKGAPGIDGMTVDELGAYLVNEWPRIREELLSSNYDPSPVRRVDIPKPGGGTRTLGIPTVLDRLIQQATLQVIGPIFDPHFSESSYGFRLGRSAHQAVRQAREFVAAGRTTLVDIDLAEFFDRVNHDILLSRVARRIQDKRLLKLIRRFLGAGMMLGGVVSSRKAGTPQGGPLSPVLSNVLLDDLDKELERRGHAFCRYADDCNIYVRSQRAGERVFESVTKFLEQKLKLRVNREKSAVDRPWKRKFLGYSVTWHRQPLLRPAKASVEKLKKKVRGIVRRGRGMNIQRTIEELNEATRGWVDYFRLAGVKRVFQDLDRMIRRRLRRIMWKQWKVSKTRFKKLKRLGLHQ